MVSRFQTWKKTKKSSKENLKHLQSQSMNEEIAQLKRQLKQNPRDALIHADLSREFFMSLKNTKNALFHIKKAINYDDKDPSNYLCLGNIYCEIGRYQKAIKAYKSALNKKPNDDLALSALSMTYLELGEKYKVKTKKLAARYARLAMRTARKSKDIVVIFLVQLAFSNELTTQDQMTKKEYLKLKRFTKAKVQ